MLLKLLGFKVSLPIFIGGVLLLAGAFGGLYYKHVSLIEEVTTLETQLENCSARTADILEDKASDATVTDPSTFPIPDHWMLDF